MTKRKIAVLTSGGDAPGMNSAIRAVVRKGLYHGYEMYGVQRGYQGVINGDFIPMNLNSVAGVIHQGGTMLKTARSEAFRTAEGFAEAVQQLQARDIDKLVVIGGDGSMQGARKLSDVGIQTVVIPGTIDNDMPGTEYTIGFDTALNNILDAANKIRDTAASHERIAVIEVMGRSAGFLALMAGLACGAEAILVPEIPMNMDDLCQGLLQSHKRGKLYSIVMVAEGVGTGFEIAAQIRERTEFKPHVTVLGYIQRGGNPSARDNITGSLMGAMAVDVLINNCANCLVAYRQGDLLTVPFAEVFAATRHMDRQLHELASILAI